MILTVIEIGPNNILSIYLESVQNGKIRRDYMLLSKIVVGNWQVVEVFDGWEKYEAEMKGSRGLVMNFHDIKRRIPYIIKKAVENMSNDDKFNHIAYVRGLYMRKSILKLLEEPC